jgi:hypothetical protein
MVLKYWESETLFVKLNENSETKIAKHFNWPSSRVCCRGSYRPEF